MLCCMLPLLTITARRCGIWFSAWTGYYHCRCHRLTGSPLPSIPIVLSSMTSHPRWVGRIGVAFHALVQSYFFHKDTQHTTRPSESAQSPRIKFVHRWIYCRAMPRGRMLAGLRVWSQAPDLIPPDDAPPTCQSCGYQTLSGLGQGVPRRYRFHLGRSSCHPWGGPTLIKMVMRRTRSDESREWSCRNTSHRSETDG